jgi:hypothetical protein
MSVRSLDWDESGQPEILLIAKTHCATLRAWRAFVAADAREAEPTLRKIQYMIQIATLVVCLFSFASL